MIADATKKTEHGKLLRELHDLAQELQYDKATPKRRSAQHRLNLALHDMEVYQEELHVQNEALNVVHEELDATAKKYSSLFHNSPVGYLVIGSDRLILDSNVSLANLLGYTRNHMERKPVGVYCMGESARVLDAHLRAAFAGERASDEILMKRKNGAFVPVMIESGPVSLGEEQADHCLMAVLDISARKRAEEELHRYQRKLETMVEERTAELREREDALWRQHGLIACVSNIQSMFIGDRPSGELFDALLLDILNLTESQYGFISELREDGEGEPYLEALAISNIAWDDETRKFYDDYGPSGFKFFEFDGLHTEAVTAGAPVVSNHPANDARSCGRLPEGHPPLDCFLGLPLMRGETVVGAIGLANRRNGYTDKLAARLEPVLAACAQFIEGYRIFRERKAAERIIAIKNDQLEQAYSEIQQFSYIVSHDLRSPLASIIGFSNELKVCFGDIQGWLERNAPNLPEDEIRSLADNIEQRIPEALEFIQASSDKMDHLVEALLKLSRLGRRDFRWESLDVQELVSAAVEALAFQIESADINVEVRDLPTVTADRLSLEQIFGNLIDNAIKYMADDRPGEIVIEAAMEPDEVTFAVRDNGRGIAREDFDDVFRIFRRVGKPAVEGEGMGLAYVRTLVHRHGGKIWVESALGEGTSFLFSLPTSAGPSAT